MYPVNGKEILSKEMTDFIKGKASHIMESVLSS